MTRTAPVRGPRAAALGAFSVGAALLMAVPFVAAGSASAASAPDCSTVPVTFSTSGSTGNATTTTTFQVVITPSVDCTLATSGSIGIHDSANPPAAVISTENTYVQQSVPLAAGTPVAFLTVAWSDYKGGDVLAPLIGTFTFTGGSAQSIGALTPPKVVGDGSGEQGSMLTLTPIAITVAPTTTMAVEDSSAARTSTPVTTTAAAGSSAAVEGSSAARTTTTSATGVLPNTGSSSVAPLLAVGEATIFAGGLMAVVLRRRRRDYR